MTLQHISSDGMTWYNGALQESDLLALQEKFHFHSLDIEDCLSEHERPKIEEYPSYLFFVFHIPFVGQHSRRILKEEVNIFLGADFIVTIHQGKTTTLDAIWESLNHSPEKRQEYLQQGPAFLLYKLMHELFERGFPLVDGITRELRRIEEELFENEEQVNVLRDILALKRNIITMRSILFPQRALVAALEHKRQLVAENLAIYFDDILDAIERQWSLLDTAKETSEALQDTHEAWLGHKTNSIVRILTIFSVTMLPLNVITGLYGMNVHLPLQESAYAFILLLAIMLSILAGFLGYFLWKKWL
jgi:magnesium transporter